MRSLSSICLLCGLAVGTAAAAEATGHAFSIVEGRPPCWLTPGSETSHELVLRNDGTVTWRAGGDFSVSYHWFLPSGEVVVWDGLRSRVPGAVEPGSSVAVTAVIRAPNTPGRYLLQIDMVHEGVTWFSQRDPTPESRSTVFVTGMSPLGPMGWFFCTLGFTAATFLVGRWGRPAVLQASVAVADVLWCLGSVVVKQGEVLGVAGLRASIDGRLLTWGGAAAVLLPSLLLPSRIRPWVVWGAAVAASAMLFADVVYYRFFGDLLSVTAFGAAPQVGTVRASIFSLLSPRDAWLILDLVVAAWLMRKVTRAAARPAPRAKTAAAVLLAVATAGGAAGAVRLAVADTGIVHQVFRNVYLAREIGVLNFHALDAGLRLWRRAVQPSLDDADYRELVHFFAERAPLREGRDPWFGVARGMNLAMIQVESLQGFVVGLEVNGQEVTPFLDRWASDAAMFTNVTDQTAQGRSSDSELSTQVSLLPPARGAAAFLFPGNDFVGMAEVLSRRGYSTISAVPFDGAFWNRRVTHRAYGYSRSLFVEDFEPGEIIGWGLNDRAFLGQMPGRLAALDPPFCAWMLTLSLHHPFEGFPDRHKVLDVAGWEGTPFGNYVHTMSFFDRALEDLIRGLESAGLADDTVVVLWGDHDAGLEWGTSLAGFAGQQPDDVGWYVSQRVPLMIRVPGAGGPRGEFQTPAGHQDVAPTVLALLGVDPRPLPYIGRNLFGEPGDGAVVGEYHCWQDRDHVYLKRGPNLADGECYLRQSLQRVDASGCAAGFQDAERQIEVSHLVLEHDLQARIARDLE